MNAHHQHWILTQVNQQTLEDSSSQMLQILLLAFDIYPIQVCAYIFGDTVVKILLCKINTNHRLHLCSVVIHWEKSHDFDESLLSWRVQWWGKNNNQKNSLETTCFCIVLRINVKSVTSIITSFDVSAVLWNTHSLRKKESQETNNKIIWTCFCCS